MLFVIFINLTHIFICMKGNVCRGIMRHASFLLEKLKIYIGANSIQFNVGTRCMLFRNVLEFCLIFKKRRWSKKFQLSWRRQSLEAKEANQGGPVFSGAYEFSFLEEYQYDSDYIQ